MVNSTKSPFKFEWNWKICVFSLIFLPVLLGLGVWQLQRAEQKRTIQQLISQQQALPPVVIESDISALDDSLQTYRRVQLHGDADLQRIWLVENQLHQGRLGYHVIMPVVLGSGDIMLVNRGWLAAHARREQLPDVPEPLIHRTYFSGQLTEPSDNRLLHAEQSREGWPKVVLQVDLASMAEILDRRVWPHILVLDEWDPAALTAVWQPIATPERKHIAYAIQWFMMATALVILTVFANSNLGRR